MKFGIFFFFFCGLQITDRRMDSLKEAIICLLLYSLVVCSINSFVV